MFGKMKAEVNVSMAGIDKILNTSDKDLPSLFD
ncbi:MAG: hypothetical protein CM15mP109_10450 [Candidatus Dadabacteria bacterium]|nr:MAG: hypothetical protein CM15mP109_10450 [Candidatus Dadabacteria bacterium]